jgi:hypothetical protein
MLKKMTKTKKTNKVFLSVLLALTMVLSMVAVYADTPEVGEGNTPPLWKKLTV